MTDTFQFISHPAIRGDDAVKRVRDLSAQPGPVARQANGTELFPLILERQLFVYTALLATLTGLIAAVAPALRAARLDPVEAIRG